MCLYYRDILKNWTKSKCYLILHFLTSKTIGTFTARSNLDPTVTRNIMDRESPFSRPTFHRLRADNWVACSRRSVSGVRREGREREKVRRKRGKEKGTPVRLVFKRSFGPLCRLVIRHKFPVLTVVNQSTVDRPHCLLNYVKRTTGLFLALTPYPTPSPFFLLTALCAVPTIWTPGTG